MRLVLTLTTEDGAIALASTDYEYRPISIQPGRYKSVVAIPKGLMNNREYFVNVTFGIPGVRKLIPGQEYLSFSCVRRNVETKYTSDHWPGALAPHLEWKIEKLD